MAAVEVTAEVKATRGGTLNWAVMSTGKSPHAEVHTLIGDDSLKSATVTTQDDGLLVFALTLSAFPGTAWNFTLTKKGESKPRYQTFPVEGVTNHDGIGTDQGIVSFT